MLWIADVHNVVANDSLHLRTPYETRHGSTPDISAYILFTFWEKILYYDSEQSFPNSKELPGHFLGVAKNSGDALTFRILDSDGKVLVRSVIQSALGKPLSGFPNKRVTHPEEDYTAEPPYPNHDSSVVGHNGGIYSLVLILLMDYLTILMMNLLKMHLQQQTTILEITRKIQIQKIKQKKQE